MSKKETWAALPIKRQIEVLKLRKAIQKKIPRSYTMMMIDMFPTKYKGRENRLYNFVNGRIWDSEIEADFSALIKR